MAGNERWFKSKAEREARKAERAEQKVERRLAAIMACDVCGYSRLMEQDEVGTVAALKGHREHLVDPKIAEHRGRIVNTAGDSVLVEFVSVVDAVRCAVDIQRGMHERNLKVDTSRKLEFRIGINVGDVIIQGNEIFGDGVNIAARLEALAQPGGILVSQTVRDYVRDKLAFGFQDLGAHKVKNISHPVTVAQIQFEGAPAGVPTGTIAMGHASPPARRRWTILVAAAVGVVILAAGAGWGLRHWLGSAPAPPGSGSAQPAAGPADPAILLVGHSESLTAVAFAPDGKRVLTGSEDDTAKLFDATTGHELRAFRGHQGDVLAVAFSPDSKSVLTGSTDDSMMLWDAETGKRKASLVGHHKDVYGVAFSPDGKLIASASQDQTVKLWDPASGKEVRTLTGHGKEVTCVAFSPDGKTLASGSRDHTVRIWDVATGKTLQEFQAASDAIAALAFSPNGKYLLTGSPERAAKLWEVATAKEAGTLEHPAGVDAAAFAPDGSWAVTGSLDGLVRIWSIPDGKLMRTFHGHTEAVHAVAVSSDGNLIVSASKDRTARIWRVH